MYRVYIEDDRTVFETSSIVQAKLAACRLADELHDDHSKFVCISGDDYDSDVPSAADLADMLKDYGNDSDLLEWAEFREANMS